MSTDRKVKVGSRSLDKEYGMLTFAKVLLAHREAEGWSQVEMAKKLKISKQSLNDLEKGRRIPSPSRAAKIAKKLGLMEASLIELSLADQLRAEKLPYKVRIAKISDKAA